MKTFLRSRFRKFFLVDFLLIIELKSAKKRGVNVF
jgi:hypothetical protein